MHTSHSYLRLVKSDAGCFLMKWQTRGQKRDVSGCQMPIPFTRGLTNMVLCNFMLRPCAIVKWQQPERSLFLSFTVTMLPTNRILTDLPKSTFCWLSQQKLLQSLRGSQTLQYCFHTWFFGRPSGISDLQYYLHL